MLVARGTLGAEGDLSWHGPLLAEEPAWPLHRDRATRQHLGEGGRAGPVGDSFDEMIADGIGEEVNELVELIARVDEAHRVRLLRLLGRSQVLPSAQCALSALASILLRCARNAGKLPRLSGTSRC